MSRIVQWIRGRNLVVLGAILLLLSGCAGMETSSSTGGAASESGSSVAQNEPYYPTNFNDFEVPGELKQERKKSMYINTASFTGGILFFSGRVEVGSLTDFFINSMQKNGWQLTGEVRYENVLLAFRKPAKNCMITVYEGEFGGKVQVYVYITEEQGGGAMQ